MVKGIASTSSIIGFIGVRMAGKPADSDHPFGHGRIEYISAFIVAFLVIQVGFSLFKTSLGKVLHPEEVYFKWISVLILLISVGVKFWLSLFNRKLGNRINSKVMEATAADAMGDVMTTSAAILSLLALKYLNWNIDGIVGLAVSVAVMYGGLNIAKDTLAPLIGERSVIPDGVKIGRNTAISGVTTADDYHGGELESGDYIIKAGGIQ